VKRFLTRSKRWFIAFAVLAGIIWLKSAPLLITVLITILSGWAYPSAVRPLKSLKFWFAIGLLVVIVPVFTGVQDRSFLWITYSSQMLTQTTLMALRGVVVFMFFQVLTVDLDSETFAQLLTKFGNKNFITLYELSREIIPNARYILNNRLKRKPRLTLASFRPDTILTMISQVFLDLIRLAERLDNPYSPRIVGDPPHIVDQLARREEPLLLIVTGEQGAGKSTWLNTLRKELANRSIPVGGIITLRNYVSESTWNLVLVDIASETQRIVATMEPQENTLETEHYYFDHSILDWGVDRLKATKGDWVIVDEVGLFEFNQQGFFPALKELDIHFSGVLVISLRKSLLVELDEFLAREFPRLQSWTRYYLILDETH